MQRGFQKGDKCQKGEKKTNRRFCTTSMNIPKPWNRKKRLVPLCFQKIPKNPGDLRCQFRRDNISPGVEICRKDVANIHLLVGFFWPKRLANNKLLVVVFFFVGPLSKVSYMVSCKFLRSKVSQLFWFWVCLWCHEESWCGWSVGSKHAPWIWLLVDLEASNVSKKQVYKKTGHMSR